MISKINFKGIYAKLYLAIALLMFTGILIVGTFSYSISYTALIDQISNEKLNTMNQTKNTADTTLKEIEKSFIAKSIDSDLLRLMKEPYADDYELLKQNIKELVALKNSSKYIYSIYVYIPGKNLIITTEDGFWKIQDFYDVAWLNNLKLENGGNWIGSRSIKTFSGDELAVTSYITPIPFEGYMIKRSNLLVINVNEKEFFKLTNGNLKEKQEQIFVIDQDAKVISHVNKKLISNSINYSGSVISDLKNHRSGSFNYVLDRQNLLTTYVKSDYNNWNYISMTPVKDITKPIGKIKILNAAVALICILLGLIVAGFVSSRLYKPIKNTVSSARQFVDEFEMLEESESKNEMDYISSTLLKMSEKNKKLKYTMWQNEASLKERFILDLLLGTSLNDVQLEERLSHFNVSFEHQDFYVMVLMIDKYSSFVDQYNDKDRALYCFGIKNIGEEIINEGSHGIMVQTDRDKFALLVNTSEAYEAVVAKADAIRNNVNKIFELTLTIGISGKFLMVNEISEMYAEGIKCAKSRIVLGSDRTIGYNDRKLCKNDASIISSLRQESITKNIKQGNISEALKNINKIAVTAIKECFCQPEEIQQFFYSILSTAIKAVNDNGWSLDDIFSDNTNLYRDLSEKDTITDFYNWIEEVLSKMTPFIMEKKESKSFSLIQKVVEYMQSNYSKDITLNLLADYVNLSTPYLSKLFKSEIGENFLEYLTKLRIDKSKELLRDTKNKISFIAESVNLGNAQNFIRIFKKYEGMTPGQYRETITKTNGDKDEES